MSGFVIIVDFRLKPGTAARFHDLIAENARASVREEPGCRRFDVLATQDDPDRVVLYEIYDDEAAFEAHLKTRHFATFDSASTPLVVSRTIERYRLAVEGSAHPDMPAETGGP
jgi:quinol monooxygenase YgiN